MHIIDVARQVTREKQAVIMRPRKLDAPLAKGQPIPYDVKPDASGKKRGWVYLDLFTASAIVTVHDALKPENQATFNSVPLPRLVDFCWAQVK